MIDREPDRSDRSIEARVMWEALKGKFELP